MKTILCIFKISSHSRVFNSSHFFSVSLGNSVPQDICCMAADGRLVFAAYGKVFSAFARSKEVCFGLCLFVVQDRISLL